MKGGMRALSIRQPFAELILRGMKTIEYRSRPTRIIGERFWIYASKGRGASGGGRVWSGDLAVPQEPLPPWMIELAEGLRLWSPGELPTGVIVGSAMIERCEPMKRTAARRGSSQPDDGSSTSTYLWHLAGVERVAHFRKPTRHPQPTWFQPF